MTKVLMVCLGNICRSPLAEGILRSKVNSSLVLVDSAGTAGYHIGHPPDLRSIEVAKKHHLDISEQRCRKFSPTDFDKFDVIYAMDGANYDDILAHASKDSDKEKVMLLLDEASLSNNEVPDPYYGELDGFETIFQMISVACESIAHKLEANGR
ncbi:low molecular weight protein-tyrosine-phosphatase [Croceitalea rosinachiae]|uniref:protein-tyrosine-phosphatase n=1 Tax=Croceitalea rosinachiae TaxID=3075596 RepID=A0ABU3AAN9_9FLAO|nr:low molecular weight protein-tyrosine-phosphatase [Croceitalea sp. F388]MDT0607252.1 low molecular weight protein-tyrosine-phosphatase [Croceitalea sp. F388]